MSAVIEIARDAAVRAIREAVREVVRGSPSTGVGSARRDAGAALYLVALALEAAAAAVRAAQRQRGKDLGLPDGTLDVLLSNLPEFLLALIEAEVAEGRLNPP